jgi:transglutaminase superfamily protein
MKPAESGHQGAGGSDPAPPVCQPCPAVSSHYVYGLRPGLHACLLDSAVIFLDIAEDRYFALTGQHASDFKTLYDWKHVDSLASSEGSCAQKLTKQGLLRETAQTPDWHRPHVRPPPIGSAHGAADANSRHPALNRRACLTAFLVSACLTRWHSFAQLIRAARRWKAGPVLEENLLYEAIDHARALHRMSPFLFTRHDACLFRSLFLVRYLHAMGIPANWEFGVRCAPFCAHCWVEYDGIILNDHQDTVLAYTKILSI